MYGNYATQLITALRIGKYSQPGGAIFGPGRNPGESMLTPVNTLEIYGIFWCAAMRKSNNQTPPGAIETPGIPCP
jgi:hypothetical protein